MSEPIKRVDGVVRWEGNNIEAIVAFMADIPALFEITDNKKLHIKVYATDGIILQEQALALEILLNDGDGLCRDGPLLGVQRNIVFQGERPGEDDRIH